jgi:hypothetical protein
MLPILFLQLAMTYWVRRTSPQLQGTSPEFETHLARLMSLSVLGSLLINPFGIVGTALGWIASAEIRRSDGALRGKWLAMFDSLCLPVALLIALLIYA